MTSIGIALPDLSAITAVTGLQDATSDPVIAGLSTGSFVDPNASNPVAALLTGTSSSTDGPATVVNLSDHAKQVLAQASADKVLADKLQAQVQAGRSGKSGTGVADTNDQSSNAKTFNEINDDGRELTPDAQTSTAADDYLAGTPVWQQEGSADNIAILQAGAQLYNKPQAMENLAQNGGQFASPTNGYVVSDDVLFVYEAHSAIAEDITNLQSQGMTTQAQALSSALENGTLQFQNASDVPNLNMQSQMIHFPDAGGGGEMGTSTLNPTGNIKAALDDGQALTLGMGDRGDFYVTW
jgi:hypothetical protein